MAYKNSDSTNLAVQLAAMGIHGHEAVTDGSFSSSRFVGFVARTAATVTFKDYNREGYYGQKTSEEYPAGYVVLGDLRDLTVTAGTIDAYYQAGERTANPA